MQISPDTKIQELKESILRTASMAEEDLKQLPCDTKAFDDVIKFGLWFEEKYKYRFKIAHSHLQQFQLIMQVNLCSSPAEGGGGTSLVSQFEVEML